EKFFKNVFFPICKSQGVDHILHGGDIFDRRKFIDYFSLKRSKEIFFNPLKESGLKMDLLVGNHDIPFRNTLSVNSPDLLLRDYSECINVIDEPTVLDYGVKILMVPWICAENHAESMNMIKNSDASIVLGHFEIQGFSMYKGVESHEGFDRSIFTRYSRVFSGHYHTRSS